MKKSKSAEKWSGFFLNLLGIILGISLTFGGNALWEKRAEKKKTKEMLILVRNELKDSKNWFKKQEKDIRKDGYVYKKILEAKDNLKSIPEDTLGAYISRISHINVSQLTSTAWQIFQNSEIIQKMSNKELLIRLTDCYIFINTINESIIKDYWNTKKKIMSLSMEADDLHDFFDAVLKNTEFAFFYTMFSLDTVSLWDVFPKIDAVLDYTIMLLDKHGNYKYNMEEKDNELRSFVEARVDSVRNSRINSLHLKNDTISKP